LHLKDGPARGMDDCMLPFGEGVVDVDAAARANPSVAWHIVEADRSRHDMYDLLRRCYDHLVGRGLATGRRPVETRPQTPVPPARPPSRTVGAQPPGRSAETAGEDAR
jgi:hypothetical protein